MSAKKGFTGFNGNKCPLYPLKIYSKEIKNNITRVDHKQNSGDIVGQSRYVLSLFLEC